ncbi:phosphoglucosamine mutase [Natronorubrum sp. FCH18a]|uniref:phosphoglucosamine mutase n=1 Tax=Natronorubrum sp. FCH18a TaxID=3447018 RepID=UPI003F512FAC
MFGTSGIRGTAGDEVTTTLALSVGRAVASEGYDRVVVGRDVRESGEALLDALTAGLRECGADVLEASIVSTPTVARAASWTESDAGIVVTASHNPAPDNGLKLWSASGQAFDPEQCSAIATRVERDDYDIGAWNEYGSIEPLDGAVDRHARAVTDAVSINDPPTVALDIGNGTGAITARALADLGCDVVTLNGHRDGQFPGRPSEPTRETLTDLSSLVEATDVRLGIAHDSDADRMVAVDDTGTFVPKDVLMALFARDVATAGDVVAAPVDTSMVVDDALAAVGGSVSRTRVGNEFVADRATRPDVVFGGEPSGAWIWPTETLCPDGPLAACKLVELVSDGASLSSLVEDVETYPIYRQSIEVAEKTAVMDRIRDQVCERYTDVGMLDGAYADVRDGWILLRASGTEPVVRITVEARTAPRVDQLTADAQGILENAIAGSS